MPDVIIKGMEMPVDCYSCDIRFGFACPAKEGKRIQQVYDRPDWCPLRPSPEWIGLVLSKYDENKEKSWIRDPVAYTLYEVWKIMDSKVSYRPSEGGDGDG